LDRCHHGVIVLRPPGALCQIVQASSICLGRWKVEPLQIGTRRDGLAAEEVGRSQAHKRPVAGRGGQLIEERLIFRLGAGEFADLEQAIGTAQQLFLKRLRVGGPHCDAEGEESSGGTVGGIACDVLVVDALVEVGRMEQVLSGLIGIAEGYVTLGLRQLGVVLAQ